MQAYEARKTSYFGTPPVNLIFALNTSLKQILLEGIPHRVARHIAISQACKAGIKALGLSQVPLSRILLPIPSPHRLSDRGEWTGSCRPILHSGAHLLADCCLPSAANISASVTWVPLPLGDILGDDQRHRSELILAVG